MTWAQQASNGKLSVGFCSSQFHYASSPDTSDNLMDAPLTHFSYSVWVEFEPIIATSLFESSSDRNLNGSWKVASIFQLMSRIGLICPWARMDTSWSCNETEASTFNQTKELLLGSIATMLQYCRSWSSLDQSKLKTKNIKMMMRRANVKSFLESNNWWRWLNDDDDKIKRQRKNKLLEEASTYFVGSATCSAGDISLVFLLDVISRIWFAASAWSRWS